MKIIFIPILLLFFLNSYAQQITETNTDLILQQAHLAFQGSDHSKSLLLTTRGLELAPDYHDIRLLQIRNYLAIENFPAADKDLDYLLQNAPQYDGVKSMVLQRINRFEEKDKALNYLKLVEEIYPGDIQLQVRKSQLYVVIKQPAEARLLARQLIIREGLTPADRYALNVILRQTMRDEIGVNYQYIGFSKDYNNSDPWHSISGEYQHNFGRTAAIARITYSDRGNRNGILYELEAYPVLNEKLYTFINIGLSNGELFPDLRGSLSVFYNFAKVFETELGGRVQKYQEESFYTGILGLTLYHQNFYFNARTFLGPEINGELVQNYQGNIRYYFRGPENYVFLRIGNGISPDERILSTQTLENPLLEAYYGTLGVNFSAGMHHHFQVATGLLYEDLSNAGKGRQAIGSVGYRYRF